MEKEYKIKKKGKMKGKKKNSIRNSITSERRSSTSSKTSIISTDGYGYSPGGLSERFPTGGLSQRDNEFAGSQKSYEFDSHSSGNSNTSENDLNRRLSPAHIYDDDFGDESDDKTQNSGKFLIFLIFVVSVLSIALGMSQEWVEKNVGAAVIVIISIAYFVTIKSD